MAEYFLVTNWKIETTLDKAWDAIFHTELWPTWWPGIKRITVLEPGDENCLGQVQQWVFRSALPYDLVFNMRVTRIEYPAVFEGTVIGELAGKGKWILKQDGPVADLRCEWTVATTKAWMNLLAPIARPAFVWNHSYIMNNGGRALAKHIGGKLISATNKEVKKHG
jgi:hypothetical protein